MRRTRGRPELAGLSILSQDVHRIFGGVVPELASRAHVQALGSVVDRALGDAGIGLRQLDGVAVTAGPGLVGALLVGVMHAKTLAYSLDRPFLGVNHLEGHLFAPTLEDAELAPPFVALLVSGGHTMLLDVPAWGEYRLLGQTLDDAAGEAFDKVAKLLGLGYPGGAAIERLAREGRPDRFRFPRPMRQELDRDGPHRYDFSFSGLKTAVLRVVRPTPGGEPAALGEQDKADIAWAFQDAATDVLVAKAAHATAGARLHRRDDRRRGRLQSRAGDAPPRPAGGAGPGERSFPAAQHRQRGDDRRRGRVAARAGRTERLGPRAARRPAPARPHRPDSRLRIQRVTIYPFKIPLPFFPHELTGYGLMMMVAFLMGGWLVTLELRRRRLSEDYSADMVAAAVIGGIIGAKLWYVALMRDPGALFERGGFVWYGGFLGGTAAVILNGWRLRVPLRWTMQLIAPALAASYALGRVGCFLVNDDYGRPTSVPWAVKFPQGLPPSTAGNMHAMFGIPVPPGVSPSTVLAVHPTQLYETALMLAAFAVLWAWRKQPRPVGWLFGLYLVFAGIERFLVEILRAKDDRLIAGTFTLAQLTSIILVAVGVWLLTSLKGSPDPAPGAYLTGDKDLVVSKP